MSALNQFDLAAKQLHTVRDCLRFAVSRFNEAALFFGHGSDNAYDEAVYLMYAMTLNRPPDQRGFDYWLRAMSEIGHDIYWLATAFLLSPEFQSRLQ